MREKVIKCSHLVKQEEQTLSDDSLDVIKQTKTHAFNIYPVFCWRKQEFITEASVLVSVCFQDSHPKPSKTHQLGTKQVAPDRTFAAETS